MNIVKKVSTILFVLIVALTFTAFRKSPVTIFIIGDSTAANKDISGDKQERGWGMALQGFFTKDVIVDNHAMNGRSSKSFIDEGRWEKVLEKMKPGDYVLIQFGHNDEKPAPERHTDPGTTFDANLRKFVLETREKGGIPVLLNAVVRRNFYLKPEKQDDDELLRNTTYTGEKVNSDTLVDTHGAYLISPRNVAKELGCAFVDANKITHDIEQTMGVEGSRKLHMWFLPGEHPSLPQGRQDNTHYSIYGAHVVASALADEIGRQVSELRKHIRHYDYIVAANGMGNYMTLKDAVDAAPMGNKTKILILNGDFQKTEIPKGKHIKIVYFDKRK
ncbi:MAG: pectin esterase [Prevotella sp.]|nr:pectin esterase [Prevotella sp.]